MEVGIEDCVQPLTNDIVEGSDKGCATMGKSSRDASPSGVSNCPILKLDEFDLVALSSLAIESVVDYLVRDTVETEESAEKERRRDSGETEREQVLKQMFFDLQWDVQKMRKELLEATEKMREKEDERRELEKQTIEREKVPDGEKRRREMELALAEERERMERKMEEQRNQFEKEREDMKRTLKETREVMERKIEEERRELEKQMEEKEKLIREESSMRATMLEKMIRDGAKKREEEEKKRVEMKVEIVCGEEEMTKIEEMKRELKKTQERARTEREFSIAVVKKRNEKIAELQEEIKNIQEKRKREMEEKTKEMEKLKEQFEQQLEQSNKEKQRIQCTKGQEISLLKTQLKESRHRENIYRKGEKLEDFYVSIVEMEKLQKQIDELKIEKALKILSMETNQKETEKRRRESVQIGEAVEKLREEIVGKKERTPMGVEGMVMWIERAREQLNMKTIGGHLNNNVDEEVQRKEEKEIQNFSIDCVTPDPLNSVVPSIKCGVKSEVNSVGLPSVVMDSEVKNLSDCASVTLPLENNSVITPKIGEKRKESISPPSVLSTPPTQLNVSKPGSLFKEVVTAISSLSPVKPPSFSFKSPSYNAVGSSEPAVTTQISQSTVASPLLRASDGKITFVSVPSAAPSVFGGATLVKTEPLSASEPATETTPTTTKRKRIVGPSVTK